MTVARFGGGEDRLTGISFSGGGGGGNEYSSCCGCRYWCGCGGGTYSDAEDMSLRDGGGGGGAGRRLSTVLENCD